MVHSFSVPAERWRWRWPSMMGLNQPGIPPGKTYVYEFVARRPGTFMYHPDANEMVQMATGMMGFWMTHPRNKHPLRTSALQGRRHGLDGIGGQACHRHRSHRAQAWRGLGPAQAALT